MPNPPIDVCRERDLSARCWWPTPGVTRASAVVRGVVLGHLAACAGAIPRLSALREGTHDWHRHLRVGDAAAKRRVEAPGAIDGPPVRSGDHLAGQDQQADDDDRDDDESSDASRGGHAITLPSSFAAHDVVT